MFYLQWADLNQFVITVDRKLRIPAKVVSKTSTSVTVELLRGGRTTWAPLTLVEHYTPPAPEEIPPEPEDTPETASKPETPAADKPKGPAGKDAFGVKIGSMASLVNAHLLEKLDNVTVQSILDNVPGSKKDNVKAHLRRMSSDGLLINSGTDKEPVVTVPPKFRNTPSLSTGSSDNGKPRTDSRKTEEPSPKNDGKRSKRSRSGNGDEDRPKADGPAPNRTERASGRGKAGSTRDRGTSKRSSRKT